jgi:hypothetical protein
MAQRLFNLRRLFCSPVCWPPAFPPRCHQNLCGCHLQQHGGRQRGRHQLQLRRHHHHAQRAKHHVTSSHRGKTSLQNEKEVVGQDPGLQRGPRVLLRIVLVLVRPPASNSSTQRPRVSPLRREFGLRLPAERVRHGREEGSGNGIGRRSRWGRFETSQAEYLQAHYLQSIYRLPDEHCARNYKQKMPANNHHVSDACYSGVRCATVFLMSTEGDSYNVISASCQRLMSF